MIDATSTVKLETRSFVVTIEKEPQLSTDKIENRLSDSLYWMEGVGKIEVRQLTVDHQSEDLDPDSKAIIYRRLHELYI